MDAITTLATVPAILALVQLLKDLVPNLGKWSALVAVLLGVGLNVADGLLVNDPVYQLASQGLILGLGAAGLYEGAKVVGKGTASAITESNSETTPDEAEPVISGPDLDGDEPDDSDLAPLDEIAAVADGVEDPGTITTS